MGEGQSFKTLMATPLRYAKPVLSWLAILGGIASGIYAFNQLALDPLRNDIAQLRADVPIAVDRAIQRAVEHDQVIKLEVSGAVSDQMMQALRDNNAALERLRTDLITEIRGQTDRLSRDIKSLDGTITSVQRRQDYMMLQMFGQIPTDIQVSRSEKLKGTSLIPIWLVERGTESAFREALSSPKLRAYKVELTPAEK